MNLKNLKSIFADNGCQKVYVKKLSPNDNSKNQVYLGGSFEILNVLPLSAITTESAGDWKRERFKASLKFSWIGNDANVYPAPNSQLILYPKYPEVRFSGFLTRCENPPSELMTQRLDGRLLFLSVTKSGEVLGYVAAPDSTIAIEFSTEKKATDLGVFKVFELADGINNKKKLIAELRRIHLLNWIVSKRLDSQGHILPCLAPNCGGYTLEAELGITPNGYSEPDFLGWEVKQFGVTNLDRVNNAIITLMTPEPTGGVYTTKGVSAFIKQYGYNDVSGKPDRMNFGGVHKVGQTQSKTNLKMTLLGFDAGSGKIRNADGKIALLDKNDNEAASWSFSSMLLHWNRKHNQACYVPSLTEETPERKYRYGSNIILGAGTDFQLFLTEMANGNIYYDPGIKIENMSTKPQIKRRSQFRIKSQNLPHLYKVNEVIDIK